MVFAVGSGQRHLGAGRFDAQSPARALPRLETDAPPPGLARRQQVRCFDLLVCFFFQREPSRIRYGHPDEVY